MSRAEEEDPRSSPEMAGWKPTGRSLWNPEWDFFSETTPVFSDYKPRNVGGSDAHTLHLVEGTGLASVTPPELKYALQMDKRFYQPRANGVSHLSRAQVEAIIYAQQSFEETFVNSCGKKVRRGFYLGDGTGVGKTRTLAGIALESIECGSTKVVWFTANAKLFKGATDELKALNKNLQIIRIENLPGGKKPITHAKEQVLLVTYNLFKCILQTSNLQSWLSEIEDPVLFFDEAHYAKAAYSPVCKSMRGMAVVVLQQICPSAKVVYSTATGASEITHLLPYNRLGLWGRNMPYGTRKEFKTKMVDKGVGAFEILSLEMKQKGFFVSRHISFKDVDVRVERVKKDKYFELLYKRMSQMFTLVCLYTAALCENYVSEAPNDSQKEARGVCNSRRAQIYAGCQNFFGSAIMSSKVKRVAQLVIEAKAQGQCGIVGIQHTGANMFERFMKEYQWSDGIPYSNAAHILRSLLRYLDVEIGCPKTYVVGKEEPVKIGKWKNKMEKAADRVFDVLWDNELPAGKEPRIRMASKFTTNEVFKKWPENAIGGFLDIEELNMPDKISWSFNEVSNCVTKEGLARLYHELFVFLPINPLDELIWRCSRANVDVSDMTGRKKMYIADLDDETRWKVVKKPAVSRAMKRFRDGASDVAIISTCSSTGISLHSDRNSLNQKKRIHITLEYGWGPENFLQQLGRSHRSNQAVPPEYVILRSRIEAEERYISIVSKRLKQLGAICHGSLEGSFLVTDHLSDDLCTTAGANAIDRGIDYICQDRKTLKLVQCLEIEKVNACSTTPMYFTKTVERDINQIFNRVLMLPLEIQDKFFNYVRQQFKSIAEFSEMHIPMRDLDLEKRDIRYTVTMERDAQINGCEYRVYGIKISRVKTYFEVCELLDSNRGWNMYKNKNSSANEVILARRNESGTWAVLYPFCREEKTLSADALEKWDKISNELVRQNEWNYAVNEIERKGNSCHEVRQFGRCGLTIGPKRKCMHQWGTTEFYVITNPNCMLLEEFCEDNMSFPLVRVFLKLHGKSTVVSGLYIGDDTCNVARIGDIIAKLWMPRQVRPKMKDDEKDSEEETDFLEELQLRCRRKYGIKHFTNQNAAASRGEQNDEESDDAEDDEEFEENSDNDEEDDEEEEKEDESEVDEDEEKEDESEVDEEEEKEDESEVDEDEEKEDESEVDEEEEKEHEEEKEDEEEFDEEEEKEDEKEVDEDVEEEGEEETEENEEVDEEEKVDEDEKEEDMDDEEQYEKMEMDEESD